MKTTKWSLWSGALLLLLAATDAQAQSGYPSKPIRIIAPTAPGSPPDLVARVLSERLASALGQPITVENRPGASNTIGLHTVAKSAPDGYTFGVIATPAVVAHSLLPHVPYDTVADLAPVSQVTRGSYILIVPASAAISSIDDLIALARSKPGNVTFASGGNGTPAHLGGALFRLRTGLDIRHVPFKGAPAGVAAILGGQVDMMFANAASSAPHVQSGRLRALATPGPHRLLLFPSVKTMAELGFPDFDTRDWIGIVAPARTPGEIVAKVAGEISKMLALQETKERLATMGMEPADRMGPEELSGLIRSELAKWAKVVREAGIRAD